MHVHVHVYHFCRTDHTIKMFLVFLQTDRFPVWFRRQGCSRSWIRGVWISSGLQNSSCVLINDHNVDDTIHHSIQELFARLASYKTVGSSDTSDVIHGHIEKWILKDRFIKNAKTKIVHNYFPSSIFKLDCNMDSIIPIQDCNVFIIKTDLRVHLHPS